MSTTLTNLAHKSCKSCEPGKALTEQQIATLLGEVPKWERKGGEISRIFKFKNYYDAMAFVNASAWISHHQDHHPDLEVGYDKVRVRYSTHSVGGLSENDFICAAKVDALLVS